MKQNMEQKYVIGIDYGTDSARAVIVDAITGKEIASSVKYYPRWKEGKYCDPRINQYRQHPQDYIDVLEGSVKEAMSKCPAGVAENVVGMAFDTTGSTPVLTDSNGTPLAMLPEFSENPNAMFVLWKDHTAVEEAAKINALCGCGSNNYIDYEGGIYSSEWVWAKMAHILDADPSIRSEAYSWMEHCDYMPSLITGNSKPETMPRSRCAAGHKAMWHPDWDGLPPEEFLIRISPNLAGFREHLFSETQTSDKVAGHLSKEWAEKLGLTTDVAVGVGAFDCHMGAVGAEVTPGAFVRIIGTSTCDIMISGYEEMDGKLIRGICGQVDGSVMPGYVGLEAGQSGFGDIYAWFKRVLAWPIENIVGRSTLLNEQTKQKLVEESLDNILPALTIEAEKIAVGESALLATDWMNGRRTPDANQLLTGTISGITLATTAPMIFRALVEATAYGSRAIIERFRSEGVEIKEVIGIGGIPLKSPFVMQVLADVINMPIKVAKLEQACAFGAAMFAAVNAGIYKTVEEAQKAMGQGFAFEYLPNPANVKIYDKLYKEYLELGSFTEKQTNNK